MIAYVSREMASAILLDEIGARWQYYRKLCVCDGAAILLKTGAKLKHDIDKGFWVDSYAIDGSDIKHYLREYGATLDPFFTLA